MNKQPGFGRRNFLGGAAAALAATQVPGAALGQTPDKKESPEAKDGTEIVAYKKKIGELMEEKISSASTIDPRSEHRDPIDVLLAHIAFAKKGSASLIQMERVKMLLKDKTGPGEILGELRKSVTATRDEALENPGRYMRQFGDSAKSIPEQIKFGKRMEMPNRPARELDLEKIELTLMQIADAWEKQILNVERQYEGDNVRLSRGLEPEKKYLPPAEREQDKAKKVMLLRERGQEEIISYIQKL